MAGTIYEWHGYRTTDGTATAAHASHSKSCPFMNRACVKKSGACSVAPTGSQLPVPICPKRLYFDRFQALRDIASTAFASRLMNLGPDGLPSLVPGSEAHSVARATGIPQVGVFGGEGWGGEVSLPPLAGDGASYKVDFTLCLVNNDGRLLSFAPIEVQTIDTTGSTEKARAALEESRTVVGDTVGLNWENVSKRILPQLIFKGLMLQGEALCHQGLFFVCPELVFRRIMSRLGNAQLTRLRRIPKQPGSITFVRYDYDYESLEPGTPQNLTALDPFTISTSDLSLAFITPENLPQAGSYAAKLALRI